MIKVIKGTIAAFTTFSSFEDFLEKMNKSLISMVNSGKLTQNKADKLGARITSEMMPYAGKVSSIIAMMSFFDAVMSIYDQSNLKYARKNNYGIVLVEDKQRKTIEVWKDRYGESPVAKVIQNSYQYGHLYLYK